jgi:hypothetical protein
MGCGKSTMSGSQRAMMMSARCDVRAIGALPAFGPLLDCGNTVAVHDAAFRRHVFARGSSMGIKLCSGLFFSEGGRRNYECEKARRNHQCPFHSIVLCGELSDDGATIAAPVPSTSPIKQCGVQFVPARAWKNARWKAFPGRGAARSGAPQTRCPENF